MCHLSYPQLLSCAYSYKYLEVLWLPKRTQLWACFNTEPNRLYRRLRLFPSKLQEYTPPPFSRLSTQYHIDPLLTCFLSLDTSRTSVRLIQQSTKFGITGILRMGDMNIHITWLTHVRTGPKKKKSPSGLKSADETRQVSTLLYCMGKEAEDVLTSTGISDEDRKRYDAVMSKFDGFFKVRKT